MADPVPGPDAPAATPRPPKSPVLAVFTSHWLAMTGLGLVLTAIISWGCLLPAQVRGGDNPYIGLGVGAVGLVLLLGLGLTPLGLYLGRRRLRARIVDGNSRTPWRRVLMFLGVVSVFNLLIASQVTMRAVHAMESRQFCGSCHVMTPEARAFETGPHSGLQCVDCHVGEGAIGFIKAKMGGTRQLIEVLTDNVHVPIKSPLATDRMVPSKETCETCHAQDIQRGARLRLIQRYHDDEANTPDTTLLTMYVGGEGIGGIHGAHKGKGVEIRFVARDKERQDIALVEYRNTETGVERTYTKAGVDAASLTAEPRILMQCFDCHNRPAHAFQLPGPAVDRAIMLGRMSSSLPFLKKTAVEILKVEYASSEAAAAAIPRALEAYYQKEHAEVARNQAADVVAAGAALADIYSRNVFPEQQVTWGTHKDNRGHPRRPFAGAAKGSVPLHGEQDAPGCFRCHGGEHKAASGETITDNCFRCHFPAAVGETKPELLELLGVDRLLKKLQRK